MRQIGLIAFLTAAVAAGPALAAEPLLLKTEIPGLVRPVQTRFPAPPFPPNYLDTHGPFQVCVAIDIDADGTVTAVDVFNTSGDPVADKAAVKQLKSTSYKPATLSGAAVAVRFVSARLFTSTSIPPGELNADCSWAMYETWLKAQGR